MFLKHYIYLNFAASVFVYVSGYAVSKKTHHGECILPSHPLNGKWIIIGGSEANPGSPVPTNSIISFSCNEPYKVLDDYITIICQETGWNMPPPECLTNAENITNIVKTELTVSRNGYGDVLIEEDVQIEEDGQPNTNTRKIITLGGSAENGIIVDSNGERKVVSVGGKGKDVIIIGNHGIDGITVERIKGGIIIDNKGVHVGGNGEESAGVVVNGATNDQREVLKVPEKTGQRDDGQTAYEDGRKGQDGLVIEEGDTVNGPAIGVGRAGESGQRKGGRGGDGVVANGGEVNGIDSRGGSASNSERKQGGDQTGESIVTDKNGKNRKKRQTVTTYYSESSSYSKSESSSYSKSSWSTISYGGGQGGNGVVIYGGTIHGNVYGVGGSSGK